jgi:beta-xylosidase
MGADGEPVSIYKKPDVGCEYPIVFPATSDEFDGPELGLQWQWNHNPVDENWSLTERPGYLRIKAMHATDIFHARNTITQKLMGNKGEVVIELIIENMKEGQRAGLAYIGGKEENWIGVVKNDSGYYIKAVTSGIVYHGPKISASIVWFKSIVDLTASTRFFFSFDGENFIPLGGDCKLCWGFWKGARVALFTYNSIGEGGWADFNWFHYHHERYSDKNHNISREICK